MGARSGWGASRATWQDDERAPSHSACATLSGDTRNAESGAAVRGMGFPNIDPKRAYRAIDPEKTARESVRLGGRGLWFGILLQALLSYPVGGGHGPVHAGLPCGAL